MRTIFTVAHILYRIERTRLDYMQCGDWLFKFHTTHLTHHSYDMFRYDTIRLYFSFFPTLVKKHIHQTYKVQTALTPKNTPTVVTIGHIT